MRFSQILSAAVIVFALAGSAQAQKQAQNEATSQVPAVPEQFVAILDGYVGWTPIDNDHSIYNWTLRARNVVKGQDALIAAARNWAFMRSEESFRSLAQHYKPRLKEVLGMQYLARGMQTAFSVSYTEVISKAYKAWFDCISKTEGYTDPPAPVGEGVLAWINWGSVNGAKGECRTQLEALSSMYGVGELTADELAAIGFLNRRHIANKQNKRFLPAEVIRQTVWDVFETD